MNAISSTKTLGIALALGATTVIVAMAGPAAANHPTPADPTAPAEIAPSPWVLRFTGEGKIVLHRSID